MVLVRILRITTIVRRTVAEVVEVVILISATITAFARFSMPNATLFAAIVPALPVLFGLDRYARAAGMVFVTRQVKIIITAPLIAR